MLNVAKSFQNTQRTTLEPYSVSTNNTRWTMLVPCVKWTRKKKNEAFVSFSYNRYRSQKYYSLLGLIWAKVDKYFILTPLFRYTTPQRATILFSSWLKEGWIPLAKSRVVYIVQFFYHSGPLPDIYPQKFTLCKLLFLVLPSPLMQFQLCIKKSYKQKKEKNWDKLPTIRLDQNFNLLVLVLKSLFSLWKRAASQDKLTNCFHHKMFWLSLCPSLLRTSRN